MNYPWPRDNCFYLPHLSMKLRRSLFGSNPPFGRCLGFTRVGTRQGIGGFLAFGDKGSCQIASITNALMARSLACHRA
jgi:hypothetical protein